jgi:RNA polymerase sigma-70 factor (ECF subfamily)
VLHLLALMLLTESCRAARTCRDGGLVLLADQDRTLWDSALIAGPGHRPAVPATQPAGPYQVQAAINAVHADAADAAATGWHQIVALYDQLTVFSPTPVVAPNRTVAVAEVDGPAAVRHRG